MPSFISTSPFETGKCYNTHQASSVSSLNVTPLVEPWFTFNEYLWRGETSGDNSIHRTKKTTNNTHTHTKMILFFEFDFCFSSFLLLVWNNLFYGHARPNRFYLSTTSSAADWPFNVALAFGGVVTSLERSILDEKSWKFRLTEQNELIDATLLLSLKTERPSPKWIGSELF